MIKTKAAVLFNINKPLRIIDIKLPNPKKGGQFNRKQSIRKPNKFNAL